MMLRQKQLEHVRNRWRSCPCLLVRKFTVLLLEENLTLEMENMRHGYIFILIFCLSSYHLFEKGTPVGTQVKTMVVGTLLG